MNLADVRKFYPNHLIMNLVNGRDDRKADRRAAGKAVHQAVQNERRKADRRNPEVH